MAPKKDDDAELLDRHQYGAHIGISGRSVSTYLTESIPGSGGRYDPKRGRKPFPAPYDRKGSGPGGGKPRWHPSQVPALIEWDEARVGQGSGGGRPDTEPTDRQTITIPTALNDAVKKAAARDRRSVSGMMAVLIERGLRSEQHVTPPAKAAKATAQRTRGTKVANAAAKVAGAKAPARTRKARET
jgi:hypothetical protein